jgi:hypothetical protein
VSLFRPGKHRKPKRFDYEPRFYDPSKDESLRRRLRIQSRTRHRRRSPLSLLYLLGLLAFALYIYQSLG